MNATIPQPDVMNAREVAAWLRVDRKTIYDAALNDVIPSRKIGRRILFSRNAIMAWLTMQGRVALEE